MKDPSLWSSLSSLQQPPEVIRFKMGHVFGARMLLKSAQVHEINVLGIRMRKRAEVVLQTAARI